jgi:hypothetical protein
VKQKCKETTMDYWPTLDQLTEQPGDKVLNIEAKTTMEFQRRLTQERTHWAWKLLESMDKGTQNYMAQPTYQRTDYLKLVTLDIEGPRRAWEKSLLMELSTMKFSVPDNKVEHETYPDFIKILHERLEMQLRMKKAAMARMSEAKLKSKQYGTHPDYMFQSLLIVTHALEAMHRESQKGLHAKGGPGVQPRTLAYQWKDPTNEAMDFNSPPQDFWRTEDTVEVAVPWDNTERHFSMQAVVRVLRQLMRPGEVPLATNDETRKFVNDNILPTLRSVFIIEVEIELTAADPKAEVERYRFRVEPYAGKGATMMHPFVAVRDTRRSVEDIAHNPSDDFREATHTVKRLREVALYGKPSEANMMASILQYIHDHMEIPPLDQIMPESEGGKYPPNLDKMRVFYHWEDRHRNGRMVWLLQLGDYVFGAYLYAPDTEHVWYERTGGTVARQPRSGGRGRGRGGGGRQAERAPEHQGGHQYYPYNQWHQPQWPYWYQPQYAMPNAPEFQPAPPPPPRSDSPPSEPSAAPSPAPNPPQAGASGGRGGRPAPNPPQAGASGGRGGRPAPRGGGWQTVGRGRGAARGGGGGQGRGGGAYQGRGGTPGRGTAADYPLPPQPRRLATGLRAEAPWQTPPEDPLRAVLADLAAIKRSLNDAQVLKDVLCG